MIHSYCIKHNIDPHKEDSKTSTIFGALLAFPDKMIWEILYNSISEKASLLKNVGTLKEYEFWPKWDNTGTSNSQYVEPDLFLRFEHLDIVVEAKRSEKGGQYKEEWQNELRAYHNEYEHHHKPVLMAIGGNDRMQKEEIMVKDFGTHSVYKCSWLSLLASVMKARDELDGIGHPQISRLCDILIMGFRMHNVQYFRWIDDMKFTHINPVSHITMNKFFNNAQFGFHTLPNTVISIKSIKTINSFFNGTN